MENVRYDGIIIPRGHFYGFIYQHRSTLTHNNNIKSSFFHNNDIVQIQLTNIDPPFVRNDRLITFNNVKITTKKLRIVYTTLPTNRFMYLIATISNK